MDGAGLWSFLAQAISLWRMSIHTSAEVCVKTGNPVDDRVKRSPRLASRRHAAMWLALGVQAAEPAPPVCHAGPSVKRAPPSIPSQSSITHSLITQSINHPSHPLASCCPPPPPSLAHIQEPVETLVTVTRGGKCANRLRPMPHCTPTHPPPPSRCAPPLARRAPAVRVHALVLAPPPRAGTTRPRGASTATAASSPRATRRVPTARPTSACQSETSSVSTLRRRPSPWPSPPSTGATTPGKVAPTAAPLPRAAPT